MASIPYLCDHQRIPCPAPTCALLPSSSGISLCSLPASSGLTSLPRDLRLFYSCWCFSPWVCGRLGVLADLGHGGLFIPSSSPVLTLPSSSDGLSLLPRGTLLACFCFSSRGGQHPTYSSSAPLPSGLLWLWNVRCGLYSLF